jgi:hypothetical protein
MKMSAAVKRALRIAKDCKKQKPVDKSPEEKQRLVLLDIEEAFREKE